MVLSVPARRPAQTRRGAGAAVGVGAASNRPPPGLTGVRRVAAGVARVVAAGLALPVVLVLRRARATAGSGGLRLAGLIGLLLAPAWVLAERLLVLHLTLVLSGVPSALVAHRLAVVGGKARRQSTAPV